MKLQNNIHNRYKIKIYKNNSLKESYTFYNKADNIAFFNYITSHSDYPIKKVCLGDGVVSDLLNAPIEMINPIEFINVTPVLRSLPEDWTSADGNVSQFTEEVVLNGNEEQHITEIGLFDNENHCYSHCNFTDAQGNPIQIVKEEGETLYIYCDQYIGLYINAKETYNSMIYNPPSLLGLWGGENTSDIKFLFSPVYLDNVCINSSAKLSKTISTPYIGKSVFNNDIETNQFQYFVGGSAQGPGYITENEQDNLTIPKESGSNGKFYGVIRFGGIGLLTFPNPEILPAYTLTRSVGIGDGNTQIFYTPINRAISIKSIHLNNDEFALDEELYQYNALDITKSPLYTNVYYLQTVVGEKIYECQGEPRRPFYIPYTTESFDYDGRQIRSVVFYNKYENRNIDLDHLCLFDWIGNTNLKDIVLESSNDGISWREVARIHRTEATKTMLVSSFVKTSARYWRLSGALEQVVAGDSERYDFRKVGVEFLDDFAPNDGDVINVEFNLDIPYKDEDIEINVSLGIEGGYSNNEEGVNYG